MDTTKHTTQLALVFPDPPKVSRSFTEGHLPWNTAKGGCTRGHDPALYVCQTSGIYVCLGCKRANHALYKRRQRGLEPSVQDARARPVCCCGCGGQPKRGNFLPGHRLKGQPPCDKKAGRQRRHQELRLLVLSHYGNDGKPLCVVCGFADIRALSVDHIHGNGNAHRRRIKKWLYLWLKQQNFPGGYQTLCMNCQMIKAAEAHERPGVPRHIPVPQQEELAV